MKDVSFHSEPFTGGVPYNKDYTFLKQSIQNVPKKQTNDRMEWTAPSKIVYK
jgi:hypothetical protein